MEAVSSHEMGALLIKRIVISGYYGFDNAGDEAVLQAIIHALRAEDPDIIPVVLSQQPDETAEAYGVEAVKRTDLKAVIAAIRHSDGLISGGGSLLQDATGLTTIPYYVGILKLAQWMGKPTFIYAQGIGPVYRKMFFPLIKQCFTKASYISVRDKESQQLLERMKLDPAKIDVVADPVLGLLPESRDISRNFLQDENVIIDGQPLIAISIRDWKEDKAHFYPVIAKLADELIMRNDNVLFVPMHVPDDRYAAEAIVSMMKHGKVVKVLKNEYTPTQLMGILGTADLVIAMRLHALIFAAAQNVPVIGISYDPKIDQFLNRLGEVAVGSTNYLEYTTMLHQVERILGDHANVVARQQQ
ncbi:MAG: polysaccharide pyruvyl transferase CsaB, partial [Bacilli bacterium]